MIKKIFIIGAVTLGAYFMYDFLPSSLKSQAKAAVAGINLSRFSPANLLPELKAKVEPYRERLLPENPVKKREDLLEKLSTNLETISKNQNPKTAIERLALETAATESKAILAELKEENQKSGVIASTAERLISTILPDSTTPSDDICKPK